MIITKENFPTIFKAFLACSGSRSVYEIGYLYQTATDGRDWANGHGPLQNNLKIVSTHETKAEALEAGAKLIGSAAPMGRVADAYLVSLGAKTKQVLGAIRKDGTLDRGYARPKQAV